MRLGHLISERAFLHMILFSAFSEQAYKGLDLPTDVKFVWNYLKNSYSQKAFTESCPADQVTGTEGLGLAEVISMGHWG